MIDLSYLKTTIGNDKKVIRELLDLFINQLPDLKNDIINSFETKNWKGLKDAAHKAKNSFQILGIKQQAAELNQMERLASENRNHDELGVLIERFRTTCLLVVREIEELVI